MAGRKHFSKQLSSKQKFLLQQKLQGKAELWKGPRRGQQGEGAAKEEPGSLRQWQQAQKRRCLALIPQPVLSAGVLEGP